MKQALLSVSIAVWALTGYHQIGIERYCNVSPADQQISCNYETAESCLGYLNPGERCITNAHPHPTLAKNTTSPEVIQHLKNAWIQQDPKNNWVF